MQQLRLGTLLLTTMTLGNIYRLSHGFVSSQPTTRMISRVSTTKFQRVMADPTSTSLQDSDDTVLDPLIVCGPSGVGKGTIIAKYMEEMGGDDLFGFTVSHTTRLPREGEEDGVHYHFVQMDKMKDEIVRGKFLEYAEVHGNLYGTSWSSLRDVQKGGKRCLLDIDVQGVRNIKTMESDILKPKYVFISPPSLETLEERLIGRGTESAESLARRTANARKVIEYGMDEDNFNAVVINDHLESACHDFATIVKKLYGL